jgi:hypothetical protein
MNDIITTGTIVADVPCPDCSLPMRLVDAAKKTYWCTPCLRGHDPSVPASMMPYVAMAKNVPAEQLSQRGKDGG